MVNFKKTRIPLFRRFVLQNFPFIEQDFDALTDYELICKVVEYLNKVIVSTNASSEQLAILTDAFNELQSYVNSYFDNLDVQEEINNKLDAMVEAGTLQEIITTYIQSNVAWTFDTVADMALATNLVDGSFAQTLGYRTKSDGGGAIYKITDTQPSSHYENVGGSLYAELIDTGRMTPEMFGAYGDGTNDDTTAVQNAINFTDKVYFDKQYSISKIDLKSNSEMLGNGELIGNTQGHMIDVIGEISTPITNVKIKGLTFKHSDVTFTQSAFIVYLRYAQNVVIEDCYFTHWTGDAICMDNFQSTQKLTKNIYIRNNKFINENTGRQGITILTASHVYIKDNYFENTSYQQMPGAIDIEPWYNAESGDLTDYVIEDIIIDGNYCSNSIYDTSFVNVWVRYDQNMYNVKITNNTVNNSNTASGIKLQTTAGTLDGVKNVFIANNNIKANFINILVSAFDAEIVNNNLTNGLISFGSGYVTNKIPITNVKFINNTYNTTSENANSEADIVDVNLSTNSVLAIIDNTFEMGATASTSWWVACIRNSLLTGNSNPSIKPIYSNNKLIYTGNKTTVALANYEYGVYSNNELVNNTSNSVNLSIIFNKNDFSVIDSNISTLQYQDQFTPTSTNLETVREITIPAGCVFSVSAYAAINNTYIKQLQLTYGGSIVADSGVSGDRGFQSVSFSSHNNTTSAKTLVVKASFATTNWNNVITTGYIIKPVFAS